MNSESVEHSYVRVIMSPQESTVTVAASVNEDDLWKILCVGTGADLGMMIEMVGFVALQRGALKSE